MKELTAVLQKIRRPKLLIRAARLAANSLARQDITLPRLRRPAAALLEEEAHLNSARLTGLVGYSATRHIEVLAVLICQANRSLAPNTREGFS